MSWRDAFLTQARSDLALLSIIERPDVADCHRLHYLQMTAEKLSKAMLCKPGSKAQPTKSHAAVVRMLQGLKSQRNLRQRLGFATAEQFRRYIDSVLPLADKVERLAPALAGDFEPNPEYPWFDRAADEVVAPSSFDFAGFYEKAKLQPMKLQLLLKRILKTGV